MELSYPRSYPNDSERPDIYMDNSDTDRSLHLPPINSIIAVKPEISIICMKCEEEINVRQLKEHQEFHNALEMFRFTVERKPSSVKQLIKRRRAIMRRLNETATSQNSVSMKKLQKLNLAYELLKADIEGTKTTLRNVDDFFPNSVKCTRPGKNSQLCPRVRCISTCEFTLENIDGGSIRV